MFHFRSHTLRLRASHLLWPVWLAPGWIALWMAVSFSVDGQVPTKQVEEGKIADANRTSPMRGLGVFGNALGIHGHDSLTVSGDLFLDHAEVTGEGVLMLKSHYPQRLVARHSKLNNLSIDNPTRVALHGELKIEKSLTVEKGVFDVSAGKLEEGATCQVRLLRGARLSRQPTWTVQSTESKTRLTNTERLVGLNADEESSLFGYFAKPQKNKSYESSAYQLIEADAIEPPPKLKHN